MRRPIIDSFRLPGDFADLRLVFVMSLTWRDIVRETHDQQGQSWADRVSDDDDDEKPIGILPSPFAQPFVPKGYADAVRGAPLPFAISCLSYVPERPCTRAEVGAPVGIREIQSILMSATQTNLSHFHTAGMTDENAGIRTVPSIADTLNCTYRPHNTSMTFTTDDDIGTVRKLLVYSELGFFVSMVRTNFTGLPDRENVWYEVLNASMYDGTILRFYLDYAKFRKFGLTLKDVGKACFDDTDCEWVASPDFMGMIDVGFSSNYTSPILSRMRCRVSGTKEITACELDMTGKVVTAGSNILAASRILKGGHKKTLDSNDVTDVKKRLGIEAAAYALKKLVGSAIVSDFMTRTGDVLSFSKHSREVGRKGLLTSMGFERPKEDVKRELARSRSKGPAGSSVYGSIIVGEDPDQGFTLIKL